MTKSDLENILFINTIRLTASARCFTGDAITAQLQMQRMRITNALNIFRGIR